MVTPPLYHPAPTPASFKSEALVRLEMHGAEMLQAFFKWQDKQKIYCAYNARSGRDIKFAYWRPDDAEKVIEWLLEWIDNE